MAPGVVSDSPESTNASLSTGRTTPEDRPTVYMIDHYHPDVKEFANEHFNLIGPDHPKVSNWRTDAEYLLVRSSYVTAEDIAKATKLRAIGKQGVGIDKIDQKACKARGIPILNTPGVNARAVAELVLTLAMSAARQVGPIVAKQSAGILMPKEKCNGVLLHHKTIGILGMGHIGRSVAQIFRGAFEADVVAYDPFLPADAWADIPHTRAQTLEDVLKASDVLTVHMPLTPQTRDLISYDQMKLMKPTSILINTARGGIINEKDLERALEEKVIWGAGLDCHEEEPPSKERYGSLWSHPVTSTPHIGAATGETQMQTGMRAAERLLAFAQGKKDY